MAAVLKAPLLRYFGERSFSKIRRGERGIDCAFRQLADMGAPRRLPHEERSAYLERALAESRFRRMRHPGNYVFSRAL